MFAIESRETVGRYSRMLNYRFFFQGKLCFVAFEHETEASNEVKVRKRNGRFRVNQLYT